MSENINLAGYPALIAAIKRLTDKYEIKEWEKVTKEELLEDLEELKDKVNAEGVRENLNS